MAMSSPVNNDIEGNTQNKGLTYVWRAEKQSGLTTKK